MVRLDQNSDAGQRVPLDLPHVAVLLLDAEGRVESWSGGAEQLLGHPAGEMLGRPVSDLIAPDDAARLPALADECRAHGGWSGLLSALRRDGSHVGIVVQAAPMTERGGTAHWLVLAAEAPPAQGWEMGQAVLEQVVTQSPSAWPWWMPISAWSGRTPPLSGSGPCPRGVARATGSESCGPALPPRHSKRR